VIAKKQPDFDADARKKSLIKQLQSSGIDPVNFEYLHESFARLLVAKRLMQVSALPSPESLRVGAEEIGELASRLALRMQFNAEGANAVYLPWLVELLSDAFDVRVLNLKHPSSLDLRDGEHQVQDAIKGWHTGQWGVWCRRLAADLSLLKCLSASIQQRLDVEDTDSQGSAAMTAEAMVLDIHASLGRCLPDGKRASKLVDLIAEIMREYELEVGITTDKIRGILRKHKKTGVSR
jgi:hypothetical protein